MGHAQHEKAGTFAETIKADHKFSKYFILSKYHMLWLSYESFSFFMGCFFAEKGHLHPKQL